jgi:hypothetical protein
MRTMTKQKNMSGKLQKCIKRINRKPERMWTGGRLKETLTSIGLVNPKGKPPATVKFIPGVKPPF